MLPKNKSKKVAASTSKRKGKALKKKTQPMDVPTNTDWTMGDDDDDDEPSLRHMVKNMGTLLSTLTSKVEYTEQRCGPPETIAASHMLYSALPATSSSQETEAQPSTNAGPAHDASPPRHARRCPCPGSPVPAGNTRTLPLHCRRRRKALKLGKVCTTDSYVTKQVRWSHEMVYTAQGQPPVYADMSLAMFTNGFMCVAACTIIYRSSWR